MSLDKMRVSATFICLFCLSGILQSAAFAQAPRTNVQGNCQTTPKPEDARKRESPPGSRGGIRVVATDAEGKPLARKRFYLLERDVNKTEGIDWANLPARDDYLKDASLPLRRWLAAHDCDSLYCPEYEAEYASAKNSVPEFQKAYADGLRKYKDPKLALRWITVNFPLKEARIRYYEKKKEWLEFAASRAGKVMSAMTDEKGVVYFTRIESRAYYISNLFPLEKGNVFWSCEVVVPPLLPGRIHSVSVELSTPKSQTGK